MKATELIQFFETVVEKYGDIAVDLNNGNGTYESINDVKVASWMDNNGLYHQVIELMHDGSYDKDESYVKRVK